MTNINAVIFDFNGVLVDDEALHFTLFREILANEGVSISERDYRERYLGYDDRRCFETSLANAGQSSNPTRLGRLIAQKARRYAAISEEGLRFFPAAAETIEGISMRWPVAICSGALRSEIESGLRQLGQLDHICVIISAEDTLKCKPDPESYNLALAGLRAHGLMGRVRGNTNEAKDNRYAKLKAVECLVIEDSVAGVISAKAAGMRVVGVTHTYKSNQLYLAGADAVVEGLASLAPDWIQEQFLVDVLPER
jgi:beta-phosphoglucomutase-like phosphatase (HAD superfamily)